MASEGRVRSCPPHDWERQDYDWLCLSCEARQGCKCLDRGGLTLTGLCAVHGGAGLS